MHGHKLALGLSIFMSIVPVSKLRPVEVRSPLVGSREAWVTSQSPTPFRAAQLVALH